MKSYQYTECGLNNVLIENVDVATDDKGQQVYRIQNINGLHKAIALGIVQHQNSISGEELRFLRTEMGLTQAELAAYIHKEHLTVGRWERGEVSPIDSNAEAIIRLLAIEKLDLGKDMPMEALTKMCVPTAQTQFVKIDGSDSNDYRLLKAAS
ncbi:MAG: helix-turn-helix domain-containing protein [Alphaproteobacteria bacterium]